MKWLLSLFGRKPDEDFERSLERYRQFRALGRRFNLALIKGLPRPALPECAKKLGLAKAGTLILNQEDEIAVAYDYCLHHYRRAGRNPIERHADISPPEPGSEEKVYLDALLAARFSLFRIEAIIPHRGARLADLLTGARIDILDQGLSSAGQAGVIVAGRLLRFADFTMSSGTLIPVPEAVYETRLQPIIGKYLPADPAADNTLSPAQAAALEARILRIALHAEEDVGFHTDIEN